MSNYWHVLSSKHFPTLSARLCRTWSLLCCVWRVPDSARSFRQSSTGLGESYSTSIRVLQQGTATGEHRQKGQLSDQCAWSTRLLWFLLLSKLDVKPAPWLNFLSLPFAVGISSSCTSGTTRIPFSNAEPLSKQSASLRTKSPWTTTSWSLGLQSFRRDMLQWCSCLSLVQESCRNFLEIANRPCESDWAPVCAVADLLHHLAYWLSEEFHTSAIRIFILLYTYTLRYLKHFEVKPCCTESDNFRRPTAQRVRSSENPCLCAWLTRCAWVGGCPGRR